MVEEGSLQIVVKIRTFSIDKIDEGADRHTPVVFRVNVKFDETSRKVEEITVEFGITINTEPNIAHFGIEGKAVVKGKAEDMERVFSTPPDTQVPNLLFEIYERLFTAIYVSSTMIDVPCPSPELLKTTSLSEEPKKEKPTKK